jgi:hypothetical protein
MLATKRRKTVEELQAEMKAKQLLVMKGSYSMRGPRAGPPRWPWPFRLLRSITELQLCICAESHRRSQMISVSSPHGQWQRIIRPYYAVNPLAILSHAKPIQDRPRRRISNLLLVTALEGCVGRACPVPNVTTDPITLRNTAEAASACATRYCKANMITRKAVAQRTDRGRIRHRIAWLSTLTRS